jgi:hypothetical protein
MAWTKKVGDMAELAIAADLSACGYRILFPYGEDCDYDLAIERDESVHFERAWLDPEAGKVFCLATGPSKEAVLRIHERAGHPTPEIYELTVEV